MRHRVFIAINLPEDVKKKLAGYQIKYPEMTAKWTKEDNLHITLIFLGYLDDNQLFETCKIVKEMVPKNQSFLITLNKICYGPVGKIPPPMIWAIGEKSDNLSKLKNDLENSLVEQVSFSPGNRAFSPHITLAKIRQWEWRRIEPEERPEVEEEINLEFPVDSIEVMESQLKRGGPEYTVLESAPLG